MNRNIKEMFHTSKQFVLVVILSLMIFGCKKQLGEYFLGSLMNENPYSGNETFVFQNNNGESIVFIGSGRYSEFPQSPSTSNGNYYYTNEMNYTTFATVDNEYSLQFRLGNYYNHPPDLQLEFSSTSHDGKTGTGFMSFNIPLTENYLGTDVFKDSLFVYNRYYYQVIADSAWHFGSTPDFNWAEINKPTYLYYNRTNGLIKMDFVDGDSWELVE